MEDNKSKIGKGGLVIAGLGVLSIVLAFFNYNLKLLSWIDIWGETTGWIIKIVLIAFGIILFFILGRENQNKLNTKK